LFPEIFLGKTRVFSSKNRKLDFFSKKSDLTQKKLRFFTNLFWNKADFFSKNRNFSIE
jgi:hypothetical protein